MIVSKVGHGKVDVMDISDVAIESDLDGLVEFIQGFSPCYVLSPAVEPKAMHSATYHNTTDGEP